MEKISGRKGDIGAACWRVRTAEKKRQGPAGEQTVTDKGRTGRPRAVTAVRKEGRAQAVMTGKKEGKARAVMTGRKADRARAAMNGREADGRAADIRTETEKLRRHPGGEIRQKK